jgi:flagellar hook-associated protein 3 FlgL
MKQQGALEDQRATIEDVDMAKAFLDLQLQQTNYSAALAVTAKVLPQTLMDFLR